MNVVLGAWLFISPWVLRYTDVSDGAINAWVFGVVTVLVALWAMSARRAVQPPMGGTGRLDADEMTCAGNPARTGRWPPATAPCRFGLAAVGGWAGSGLRQGLPRAVGTDWRGRGAGGPSLSLSLSLSLSSHLQELTEWARHPSSTMRRRRPRRLS